MTAPVSVFADLARDDLASAGRFRSVDARRRAGKRETVLYTSDFDTGFDNWTDHWDAFRPLPPISLTNHAAPFGGRSLMLSTSEGAYTTGNWANAAAAFRRITRPSVDATPSWARYQSLSGWFGLGIGNYDNAWGDWGLLLDTNRFDNTGRNFYRLICGVRPYPDGSRWQISAGNGTANVDIPNTTGIWHGDNDNKVNFEYVRLTIDRLANGGAGGYHEAQIGPHVFSLARLGAGSAPEPLQDNSANITRFNGGDNLGLSLSRNSGTVGGCQLFANGLTVSVSDQA